MRALLADWTFTLTDSALERLFIPFAIGAGLPRPECQAEVNGHRVDFLFEDLGLVVETDGGRFHRTAAQQTQDRRREHAHLIAGLRTIRFTHDQIAHEATHVERVLKAAAQRASSYALGSI
jgi:very-short-patch-repair endonuclease